MTFQHNSNLDISLKLTGVMSNMGADIFMIVIGVTPEFGENSTIRNFVE